MRKPLAVSFWSVAAALTIGCGGGGGPSSVVTFEVSGSWVEVSTLVADFCGLDLLPTSTTEVTVIQSQNQVTFVFHSEEFGDTTLIGTFNSRTGEFSLPFNDQQGGVSLSVLQSGRFTSNTRYTSETTIVISEGAQNCTIRTSEVGQRRT